MKYPFLVLALCAPGAAGAATLSESNAGPIDLLSGTFVRTIMSESFETQVEDGVVQAGPQVGTVTSGDSSLSYRTNHSTGELGVGGSTVNSADVENVSLEASLFDTVSFDFGGALSGLVEFKLDVEGFLSNTDGDGGINYYGASTFGSRVQFDDVTGLDSSFFLTGADQTPRLTLLNANSDEIVVTPADEYGTPERTFAIADTVASARGWSNVGDYATDNCAYLTDYQYCSEVVDSSGEDIPIFYTLVGSFLAEAGKTYALRIGNSLYLSGGGTRGADFMSTSTFSFTNTSGGIVYSASGELPGTSLMNDGGDIDAPVPVPLPASAFLLLGGLGSLALRRRKRA